MWRAAWFAAVAALAACSCLSPHRAEAAAGALARGLRVGASSSGAVARSDAASSATQHRAEPPANYLMRFPPLAGLHLDLVEGPTISYNTTEFVGSGMWVEVALAGVHDPSADDLLAVFSPPDAHLEDPPRAPVKYELAAAAGAAYLSSGEWRLALRLVNLREDFRVVLVRHGDFDRMKVVAEGPVITNANKNEMTGIHLMLGHRPWEMVVQWTSRSSVQPTVRYGSAPGQLQYVVPATTVSYTRDDLCGAPANAEGFVDPGSLHTAVMTGLEPGSRVFYTVGDQATNNFSPVHSFLSHPGVGPDVSVDILALADQGVGEPDATTAAMEYQPALDVASAMIDDAQAREASGLPYTLVLHPGDISYARGFGALWDTWLYQQSPLLERMPTMVAAGNHERDWPGQAFYKSSADSGGECGVPYSRRFPMPAPSPRRDTLWYSFDYGPVHFAVMSTEHDFTAGSRQLHWLEGDLAGVERERTPWVVLVGHRPIYIDADDASDPLGKQTTALQLQTALEHMLVKNRVDLTLSGHHHSYQRTCPVVQQKCTHHHHHHKYGGPVHVCLGHAGADFYDNGYPELPEWVAYEAMTTHGYVRISANGTAFALEAVDTGGEVFDSVVLHKKKQKQKRSGGERAEDDALVEGTQAEAPTEGVLAWRGWAAQA